MKKLGITSLKLLSISLLLLFIGCEKFKLLKDEDMDLVPAGENTKNATFAAFIKSNDYQQSDRYSQLKLYAQAVRLAGLEEFLDNPNDNFTIVIFNDDAMNSLITGYGYTSLEEAPRPVLRHFILNNIIQHKYQVADFEVGKDEGFESLTGDSLFFRRESSTTNPYVLRVNAVSRYASASVTVRSRDLPFKNAIGHVVPMPTYTVRSSSQKDPKPDDLELSKDSVFVEKDVLLQFASSQAGYQVINPTGDNFQTKMASTINNTGTRRLYMQYKIREPEFEERLGSATLMLYHTRTSNASGVSESLINVYADAYTDWEESTTSYSDLPAMGELESSFSIPSTGNSNKWFASDVSRAVLQAFENNQDFVNIGVWSQSSPNVYFGHLGHANAANNKSYILFESTPETIITNVTVNAVNISSADFFKVIDKTNLQGTGASDKNISYFLSEDTQKGVVLVNGRPLRKRGSFTQEQLRQGVVKYLRNLDVQHATDEIILEVQDFQGGFYPEIITLPVQIN